MSSARWAAAEAEALMKKRKAQQDANAERLIKKAKQCMKPALRKYASGVMIGIDPGTNTGIAVRDGSEWKSIQTLSIIEAIDIVCMVNCEYDGAITLRIEDARLRTFFGNTGPEKWKGAGSIIRDCRIWEHEMERQGIPVEWVHPKNVKATTSKEFKEMTGWSKPTSIHAREAAWMIL